MDDPRETDLFGNPVRPGKGRRGRPPRELTQNDFDMLEAALMQGWTNQRTAQALGVGVSTLKRKFGPLLGMRDQMPDRLKLIMFSTAVRKAMAGDMGAMRQLRQMIGENDLAEAERRLRQLATEGAAKSESSAERLGKKALAQKRAEEIAEGESDWGSDLIPGFQH